MMNFARFAALSATALAFAGCSDSANPGSDEVQDRASVNDRLPAICGGTPVEDVAAVNHAGHGKTSGFIVLCADGTLHTFDDDGGAPGDEEKRNVNVLTEAVKTECGDGGADRIIPVDHAGHGKTSGFLIRCRRDRSRVVAIGR